MIKPVKYIYYQLFQSNLEEDKVYSLLEIIKHLAQTSLKERIIEIDYDKYRLENIKPESINNINFVHLRFMRLDEANIPNLSYENRESSPLVLQDGEYLGTPLHILYDVTNEVCMIQQSRTTMTVGKLNKYLNSFVHSLNLLGKDYFIEFRPILSLSGVRDGAVYSKIELRFANIERAQISDNTDLQKIIDVYNDYQAITGSITMSLGHYTSRQLLGRKVRMLSRDVERNKEALRSARLYYKTEDYTGCVDLIQDIIGDEINFDIEKRSSLSFDYAQREMLQRYLSKLNEILNELNRF